MPHLLCKTVILIDCLSSRYWGALQWRSLDVDLLSCSHITLALNNQLQCMEKANSHYDVKVALSQIMAHLLADKRATPKVKQRLAVEALYTLKWESAFERYFPFCITSSLYRSTDPR